MPRGSSRPRSTRSTSSPTPRRRTARAWYRQTGLRRRLVRLRLRGFRDDLRHSRRDAQHHPRAPLWRRDPRQAASLVDRVLVAGRRRELRRLVQHARGAAKGIRAHAPKDEELHRIADELQAVQRKNFLPASRVHPPAGPLLPRVHHGDRGRARQPDLAAPDGRCRGHGDRGHARPRALALPPAPRRVRAPDLRRRRRRDPRRQCLDFTAAGERFG